jgi:curved DNA-binding protein CbpA
MRKSDLDYYKTIGISPNSSYEELKKAYRRLALCLHPDKNNTNQETESDFIEITEAYQYLSKKYEYINAIKEAKERKKEKETEIEIKREVKITWGGETKDYDSTNQRTSKNCCIHCNRLKYYENENEEISHIDSKCIIDQK